MKQRPCLIAVFYVLLPIVCLAQGISPEIAVQRMKPADGLVVKVVASEPLIRQPVTITFDTKGRPWVIQYLQYPSPAGLKAVEVDQYLRTKYDRHPEPPPHGPRGLDRVTILTDPDKTGRFQKSKDFITGLNLASGLALGNQGVYVLQAPYLLFYPDRNEDDVPDGEPEILLDGFGMEDAHALGNSLVWGPDGWLYGAQGSTVTARIKDPLTKKIIEFQQGIWRYHPRTRQFELFAEGGGNTWGLDFDKHGQIIAGTNWGGVAALHQVQEGYYIKGFAKHGPLHNPYTFGYLDHIPCQNFRGGHVTCGGIIYQGTILPKLFQGNYIGCNLLDNNLYWYSMLPKGSTFAMKHEGTLLQGNDPWFRPIDLLTGPDGAIYVVDWYDKRANHVDPVDNWDKTNGRIYKITTSESHASTATVDLAKCSSVELIRYLTHSNSWQRSEARRLLGERHEAQTQTLLQKQISQPDSLSVDLLGALYSCGGLTLEIADQLLRHPQPEIRCWTVRFVSDHATPEGILTWQPLLPKLVQLAKVERSLVVLSQLASTAKRLIQATQSTEHCYSILRELITHDEIVQDGQVPLLAWWSVEAAIAFDRGMFQLSSLGLEHVANWQNKFCQEFLLERISRRLMADGSASALASLSPLLRKAIDKPDGGAVNRILTGIETALEGRRLQNTPDAIIQLLKTVENHQQYSSAVLRLLVRLGNQEAFARGLKTLVHMELSEADRSRLLGAMTTGTSTVSVDTLLQLWSSARTDSYRSSILDALAARQDAHLASTLLTYYSTSSKSIQARIVNLLMARKESSLILGQAVVSGQIAARDISLDQVRQLVRFGDHQLNKLVAKQWGNVSAQTTGEKQARIRSILHMLNQRSGDAGKGKPLFVQHCSVCHQLFGEGGKVGPELTSADRQNREFLVTHIVDPHFVIRPEYTAYTLVTTDGRTLTGLLVEQNTGSVTLLDAQANKTTLARDKIEDLQPSRLSLMPEKILDVLDEQQIRDFFAYLQLPEKNAVENTKSQLPFPAEPLQVPVDFDFADKMVKGIDRHLDRELADSARERELRMKKDLQSPAVYQQSLEKKRQRWRTLLGLVDERPKPAEMEYISSPTQSAKIGRGASFDVYAVRWRAFGEVYAEGLLLQPDGAIQADVIALPDADQSPEHAVGLVNGLPHTMQFARHLAQQGCRVIVPVLIDRKDTFSGVSGIRMTNQPHREWIYRQSFEMGRHIIGYEIQKVLAAIDWLHGTQTTKRPLGMIGYAEGGLLALFAGALDERIAVTCVDGYFSTRESVWKEPIYRNIWNQLKEFGDAEIASLYPPRQLVINQLPPPAVDGPPPPRAGRTGAAPGRLLNPEVTREWQRLEPARRVFPSTFHLNKTTEQQSIDVSTFLRLLTGTVDSSKTRTNVEVLSALPDAEKRMQRQVHQLAEHAQQLFRKSQAYREKELWSKLDRTSLQKYEASLVPLRNQLEQEVIGKIHQPAASCKPRARKLYEHPAYVAYEVELDVFTPDVIAYGWLLLPRDIKPGERRPVVVCQHGLDGRPSALADPQIRDPSYHQYGCRLAERGFVVFAPQNPYIFGDRFRMLQRKANPLGWSLFSFIVAQHRQITDWLASLSFVDPERIGFYGLSYGGKTAMRVPALVPRYCLSICSADFNEWIWKNVSIDNRYTYMTTGEWEMVEWNLGHTFNYAELAALIAPRPFMVERGHRDGVAPDEQVAYEYARVRRLYADLKIPERTTIEFFDGPHTINGQESFRFLHEHLRWPFRP